MKNILSKDFMFSNPVTPRIIAGLILGSCLSACDYQIGVNNSLSASVEPSPSPSPSVSASPDVTPPTVGAAISFEGLNYNSVTVKWGAATDDVTAASELKYKLVRATTLSDINTVAKAEAVTTSPGLVMDWTADVVSKLATGLTTGVTYYFAVLVQDAAGNMALYSLGSTAPVDQVAPTAPNGGVSVSFSNVTDNGLTVNWDAATDDGTTGTNLEYKVVRAVTTSAINTITNADAVTGSDLLMDWTANLTSKSFTGLTVGSTYAYTVLVRDSSGNKSLYIPKIRPLGKMIYRTTTKFSGNLSGVTGADSSCSSSRLDNVDTAATIKALIVDGTARVACSAASCSGGPSSSWIMSPSIEYFNSEGQSIGTTTSNKIFTFPLTNPIKRDDQSLANAWTGLSTSNDWVADSSNSCSAWSSSSSGTNGILGKVSSTTVDTVDSTMMSLGADTCDKQYPLYCVEQVGSPVVPDGAILYLDSAYVSGTYDTPPASCGTLTWTDLTTNHNDGTLTSFLCDGTDGWGGSGTSADPFKLTFNSAGRVPTSLDVRPSAMPNSTWEVWVKPTRLNHTLRQQILSNDNGGWDRSVLIEANTSMLSVFLGTTPGSDNSHVWKPVTATSNTWQHVAVVWASNNLYLYKNGTQYTFGSRPNYDASAATLMVGSNPAFGEQIQGDVALFAIYNRALSAIEISDHCKQYQSRFAGVSCN
jgi:hypothetical protein